MRRTGAAGWLLHDVQNRGITAWCLSAVFTAFYIGLYFSYTQEVQTFTARPIGELPGDWRLFGTLLAAVLASRRHFDKEERIVFPMAEKLLKPKTLLALGGRWGEQRTAPEA